ncbi:DUF4437 domain-containing protein [uncultured Roseibium sp.]|uniref:DUF4437 domain-containing protein n=1 Tax=uncultured Roseibium sp. TaxID=1936171 RepID=UPI00263402F6|nr:DUF4437 domain-containing protein [uncultured Roseibium sp.]
MPGERTSAWTEEDGASGSYLSLRTGDTHQLSQNGNAAKAVILAGEIRTGDISVGSGGYLQTPAGEEKSLNCMASDGCLLFLEEETRFGIDEAKVVPADDIPWQDVPNTNGNVSLAWVWGERESEAPSSFFLKFKPGFPGFPHEHTHTYRGLVVKGDYRHWALEDEGPTRLPVGANLWQDGDADHDDACGADGDCVAYFRIEGHFDIFPAD